MQASSARRHESGWSSTTIPCEAPEIFYAVGRERGEFRRGDTVLKLAIRTTRLFRLLAGHWRQVHHHGSFDDPELLARYQEAVRAGKR